MRTAGRTNLQSSSGLVGERLSASVGHDVKIKRVVKGLVKRDRLKFVKVNKGGDGSGSGEGCTTQNDLLFIQFPPPALDANKPFDGSPGGILGIGAGSSRSRYDAPRRHRRSVVVEPKVVEVTRMR